MDPPSEADDNQVTEFLQRIRELDDKRDREDEERTRKLEEDIMASKAARQKLRAGPGGKQPCASTRTRIAATGVQVSSTRTFIARNIQTQIYTSRNRAG
ncbi:hypothetical protein ABW21_db0207938 [Orbilia brochopaga]|nr:hypothetical protein ABW21_db0207938 [Drechslerella brochopaga]